jgi:hypothetical protein
MELVGITVKLWIGNGLEDGNFDPIWKIAQRA